MNDVDVLGDAQRLRAFLAVVEAGGFSRAAIRLGVRQPTVSSLVAALERRAGAPLLVRSRAGVRLTPAGEALLPHAQRLMATAEEARRAVDAAVSRGRRRLAVAGGEALVTHLLPPALARLRRTLPRLAVTVRAAEPARALADLRAGEVSCVLAALAGGGAPDDLETARVGEDRLVLVGPPGEEGDLAAVPLADALRGRTLVVREAGRADRAETEAVLRTTAAAPADRLVVAGLGAAVACVAAGLGRALLPGIAAREAVAAGRVRVVATAEVLPALVYALCARPAAPGGRPDPLVGALAAALRAAAPDAAA
ncbi:MAG TPA: LysR family transcriptional regulator [Miltoncostaeaceae bacterium]|nr:LysR family transcriptional regulator [Miltoncostaeaceae bacterium]